MTLEKLERMAQRERERQEKFERRVFCCISTACLSAGAGRTINALQEAVDACQCDENDVEVVQTGCMGLCSRGPLVRVEDKTDETLIYADVDIDLSHQIIAKHVPMGKLKDETDSEDVEELREKLKKARRRKGLKNTFWGQIHLSSRNK